MHFLCRPVLLVLLLLGLLLPAEAQEFLSKRLVTPTLKADTNAIVAGKPFTAGILLKIDPGWHTYWQFGGDSGAPTKITWELPEGFSAGPIQWPIPTARPDEGDQLTYVYENEVMLLVEITPPAQLPPSVTLKAKVRWLACKETCIPGDGEVSLVLPGKAEQSGAEASAPTGAASSDVEFARWRAQLPKNGKPPFALKWSSSPRQLQIAVQGISKEFNVEFFPIGEGEIQPGHPKVSEPAADGSRTISVPFEGSAEGVTWKGVLVTQKPGAPREGWQISAAPATAAAATTATTVVSPTPPASGTAAPNPQLPVAPGLLTMLWGAFLGGLVLNLMPCVLPVIALKIFGFVQQAGEAPQRVFRLGLAFVGGVFAFFLGLASLVVAFQSAGHGLTWGFQFQNPTILAALIALVFVFALAMFGVFEITIGSQTATTLDQLSRKEGYGGAFVHGMFTTLLGTSCTAPLLGPVLGFAFVQPAHIVFLIFCIIAAGMSLPYFLLTWQPAWMRFLPKPGAWMERLKQLMGFVLLGVVVWLLGVFGHSHGIDGVIALTSFLLVLGLAGWIYGVARSTTALILVFALVAGGWWFFIQGNLKSAKAAPAEILQGGIGWKAFSPEHLSSALSSGQAVFVDFTADWCLNCKYNERFVLETDPVRAAFLERKIVPLKADWTNGDPVITKMLKEFGRVGVPAYVIYPANGSGAPIVLPEILTQSALLKALESVRQ